MRSHYDVIVIGSGYGGSIAASRLSRSIKTDGSSVRVCLIERGKETPVGEFPNSIASALPQFQMDSAVGHLGDRAGLYHLRFQDDISVFSGCGLGGTSLVNANVSLQADARVFAETDAWPRELLDDMNAGVAEGYRRARKMLQPLTYPENYPHLRKRESLLDSAEKLGSRDLCKLTPINVSFKDGLNHVGVQQPACNGCGDCVSGCNYGSKGTVTMNYIPDARNHGAEIFCQVDVRHVRAHSDGWAVHYVPLGCHRDKFHAEPLFVTADVVIVAAGTVGSNEILLRSRRAGLNCSDRLGHGFTGNGDVLAFGYNMDQRVNGIGAGSREVSADEPCGPCITSVIDLREQENFKDGMVIEEGSLPGALAPALSSAMSVAADATGTDTDSGFFDEINEKLRQLEGTLTHSAYRGAVANTQTYLVMSHDDAGGRVVLDDDCDSATIKWPGVGRQPIFEAVTDNLKKATSAWGGTYVPNPQFTKAFDFDLITVHPLGGCAMADSAEQGVVDSKGRVFSGDGHVHDGLYVSDGSIMPRSLGVNPLLTISALSERNMALLAKDRGWQIDYGLDGSPAEIDGTRHNKGKSELQFTEKMSGHVSTTVLNNFEAAESDGKSADRSAHFVLTVLTEDLDHMLDSPEHETGLFGSVSVPVLSSHAMTSVGGRFNLFSLASEDTKQMRYRMRLHSVEGRHFYFDGFKSIRNDSSLDLWSDTTTLYVTVYEGNDDSGEVVAKGMLHIAETDFAIQMTTMEARKAGEGIALEPVARFGKFFAGELWDTYGAEALKARKN
jgi:cholesterol oxidase